MKIMSSVSHSHVVPNLYEFLSSAEHKRRFLKSMGDQTSIALKSQWGPSTVWLATFFKIPFVFSRGKKFMQVWNNLKVSKL